MTITKKELIRIYENEIERNIARATDEKNAITGLVNPFMM